MQTRPTTEAEFRALAYKMADSHSFKGARHIFHLLSIWPDEIDRWWTEDLAAQVDERCRGKR